MIAVVAALVLARSRARFWLARDSFHDIVARLDSPLGRPSTSLEAVCATVKRTEAIVDRVPGVGRKCMHRALGRFAALRRAGIDATLLLGVRDDGDFVGHAWVEVDGVPVLEREPPRFTVTFSSSVAPARTA